MKKKIQGLILALAWSFSLMAQPLKVVISENDVYSLGGWPIDKKWYAVAIQHLIAQGASRIFIDIAFPFADAAHPESDEFLYSLLQNHPNIFLLSPSFEKSDSITVLSTRKLSSSRFFLPFSTFFQIENGKLFFDHKREKSLVSFLTNIEKSTDILQFDFPHEPIIKDESFTKVIQNDISCYGKDVLIYLDFEGVTSYIVSDNSLRQFSTTELQLWAISERLVGNEKKVIPIWRIALIMTVSLFPFALYKLISLKTISMISLLLSAIGFFFLKIGGVHVSPLFLLYSIIPFGTLLWIKVIEKKETPEKSEEKILETVSRENTQETEELRYKLKYYETLSNQAPIESLVQSNSDIQFSKDSPLREILVKAKEVAKTEMPVLIFGESGTGKEKVAQFIHQQSLRCEKPFIAVNCGSLNENLIESELFGYEQGAFTGATKLKQGRFEQANGGTLFLDEIGETSLAFQVKLLRILQEGIFERVGGTKSIKISVRIIGATHQSLHKLIEENRFRQDLYYRLNGFSLVLPPLRERPSDIEHLFRVFLHEQNSTIKISEALVEWLKSQVWQGNIRELKSATERAVINAAIRKRNFLLPDDFELNETSNFSPNDTPDKVLEALRKHEFKHRAISATAEDLSMHRVTVTEHFRGWVIHFLNKYDSREHIYSAIKGDGFVHNEIQFQERIDGYIESIYEKIREGINSGESHDVIKSKRFKGVPNMFEQDLKELTDKLKKGLLV